MSDKVDLQLEWLPSEPLHFPVEPLRKGLLMLCIEHEYDALSLEINLLSDKEILKLNREYLQHDYYTDILTFDLGFNETAIEGSLYISFDTVARQAKDYKVSFEDELLRVIIHGVLHLAGYDDATCEDKKSMRKLEDYYLDQCFT